MGLMRKCLICGEEFPDELIDYPIQRQPDNKIKIPREICGWCAKATGHKAKKMVYDPPTMAGFLRLAGSIEQLTVRQYRDAYFDALKSASKYFPDCKRITDAEVAFLRLHKEFATSVYHYALTMGHNAEIADATRRDVEKEFKYFKVMRKQGYDIFKRGEENGKL